MLLQTLVQLNILILATPALAGWVLLPLTQPGVVRACVVTQGRAAEAAAPKTSPVEVVRTLRPMQPAVLPAQAVAVTTSAASRTVVSVIAVSPAFVSSPPFPHAARAP